MNMKRNLEKVLQVGDLLNEGNMNELRGKHEKDCYRGAKNCKYCLTNVPLIDLKHEEGVNQKAIL